MLVLQSLRLFRLPSYELFLRSHQAAALVAGYAIWKHVHVDLELPRLCVYISAGIFVLTSVLQCLVVLYRNVRLGGGYSRALISKHHSAVRMSINVPRPLEIRAGQYVNVWIPSVSFWSFLQSHPFTIASWTQGEATTILDLIIEPRRGFTQKLFACAESYVEAQGRDQRRGTDQFEETFSDRVDNYHGPLEEGTAEVAQPSFGYKNNESEPRLSDFRLALFSGPHGAGVSAGDYGKVLMVATGFGIAAQLPYLKELVSGFNDYRIRTREIRLVWQLQDIGKRPLILAVDERLIKHQRVEGRQVS